MCCSALYSQHAQVNIMHIFTFFPRTFGPFLFCKNPLLMIYKIKQANSVFKDNWSVLTFCRQPCDIQVIWQSLKYLVKTNILSSALNKLSCSDQVCQWNWRVLTKSSQWYFADQVCLIILICSDLDYPVILLWPSLPSNIDMFWLSLPSNTDLL